MTIGDIQTVLGVLPQIRSVSQDLLEALRDDDQTAIESCQLEIRSWVRSIKGDVPEGCLPIFKELELHAIFVETYFAKQDYSMMRRNTVSIGVNLEKLRICLLQTHPGIVGLGIDLEKVSKLPQKDLLEEAVSCYAIGAYRGAILNAISALEATLRDLARRQTAVEKPPSLYRVIKDLEKRGQLEVQDEPILQLGRLFRNLVAHPSEFQPSEAEARGLIILAFQRLVR